MKRIILLYVFLCMLISVTAQTATNSEWKTYLEGYNIYRIADAGEYLWLCSYKEIQDEYSWHAANKEIIQFEKVSGNTIHYGFDILGISPEHFIRSIECDKKGLPWACGDFQGILRLTEDKKWVLIPPFITGGWKHEILIADDGVVWTTADNILIKHDGDEVDTFRTNGYIMSLAEDTEDNIWMGTSEGFRLLYNGLVKFDGEHQTIYNSTSTGLPPMVFLEIIFDKQGNKWMSGSPGFISLFGGNKLIRFNDLEWNVYDLPVETYISSLVLQNDDLFWLGTDDGLMRFTNSQWTIFNKQNSGLPTNEIHSVVSDDNGIKWIGTDKGLVSFSENDLKITTGLDSKLMNKIELFPNPAKDYITLKMRENIQSLTVDVLSIQGIVIKSFNVDKNENRLNVDNLPAGVYLLRVQLDGNHILKKFVKQ